MSTKQKTFHTILCLGLTLDILFSDSQLFKIIAFFNRFQNTA